jgi:hypothetical protein
MAFDPGELRDALTFHGFHVERLVHRDFLHPKTPPALMGLVDGAGKLAERLPLIQRWSGSLWCSGSFKS